MSTQLALYFSVLLALYLGTLYSGLSIPLDTDFTKFYASAVQFEEETDIYATLDPARFALPGDEEVGEVQIHPNLNPPLLTLLMLPLSRLPWSLAYILFTIASLVCGLAAMFILWGELGLSSTRFSALILSLLFYPTWANIRFGQISLFLFLLLVWLWRDSRRGSDTRAGLILGFLMGLKLFTGLFLLYFLLKRRFKLLLVSSLVFGLSWGLCVFTFGIGVVSAYRQALSQVTWTGASWNASLQGFFSRLFGGSEGTAL